MRIQGNNTFSEIAKAGRIFKVVKIERWDQLANSLVDPEHNRSELRERINRSRFTVRLNSDPIKNANTDYEIVDNTNKTPLHRNKIEFTRHQSASYANPLAGYEPSYFGKGDAVSLGISASPANCIFNRIMVYADPTFHRPYDFETKKAAQEFIIKQKQNNQYHTSLESLLLYGLHNHEKLTEVQVGFKWVMQSNDIVIFSDNLESRLIAQAMAIDLKKRFGLKYREHEIIIPISKYPKFLPYTIAEQLEDRKNIASDKKHYLEAILFLETGQVTPTNERDKIYNLLKNIHSVEAEQYKLRHKENEKYNDTLTTASIVKQPYHSTTTTATTATASPSLTLKNEIINLLDNYIRSRGTYTASKFKPNKVGFFFRNYALTEKKINSAHTLKNLINVAQDLETMIESLKQHRDINASNEQRVHPRAFNERGYLVEPVYGDYARCLEACLKLLKITTPTMIF
ncbi:MAG: hypothetical protein A3E82_01355 [Gammaproteobacteria bacterium RIFCSPHIGHO2_12_FULL_38_11]|nr:MAG: hypothetical protein A3E82_01355 [Gammaproteobacteria bacterium RIFCSPHIGHO2_12_FULL_38_11]